MLIAHFWINLLPRGYSVISEMPLSDLVYGVIVYLPYSSYHIQDYLQNIASSSFAFPKAKTATEREVSDNSEQN